MRKIIITALLFLSLFQMSISAEIPNEVFFIPWGTAENQIKLTETPFGWQGVESFQVIGKNVYLLTSNSGQILKFSDQNLGIEYVTRHFQATDFQLGPTGTLEYIMDHRQIYEYSDLNDSIAWVNTMNMRPNSRLLRSGKNSPSILLGLSETLNPRLSTQDTELGVLNLQGDYGRLVRRSDSEMTFYLNDVELSSFQAPRGIWGSGQYLGSSESGNHYLLLETILKQNPLGLTRTIQVLDASGKSLAVLDVPALQHIPVTRQFQIAKNDVIFGMFTLPDGVHLLKWDLLDLNQTTIHRVVLPEAYQNIYPRPFQGDNRLPHERTGNEKNPGDIEIDRLDFPPVGREESLLTADEYVALIWTANAENLTNGVITDPGGNAVQTPTWIQLGQNQRMAYQWGGFSTIDGYVNGLANGKYAGDMATSAVSSYAVGVDCSGFVSRCWNMPQHYSTYMMSHTQPLITLPLNSWYDLRPGDAIHKVGHVRLAVLWNTNGTILAVEAGGGWITHYQSYSISQLADYQPRYYVYMEGMPANIDRPVLGSVIGMDSTRLSWALADSTGIRGIQIDQKDIFQMQDWETLENDPVPTDQTSIVLPSSDLSLAWRLHSISTDNPPIESYPSDAYAFANKGSVERLLIVDGFDRTTGSYPFPYHEFVLDMAKALGHFNYSFATADNDAVLAGSIPLADYTAVFWLLGDESTVSETFSAEEQDIIEAYLTQGGKLFASGSEIAWDLDSRGNTSDQEFFHNYLKASFDTDDSESYTINGVSGTPFEGLTLNYDDGNNGVYEENYPDAFQTTGGSQAVLKYANDMIAATAYTGVFGSGSSDGQVVLLGIPFETIYNDDQQLALTTSLLSYFGFSTLLGTEPQNHPTFIHVLDPFPSPFNNTTQIRFVLSEEAQVEVDVFDLRGRFIAQLRNKSYSPGQWQIPFYADDLPGGLYLIRITSGEFVQTRQVVLLK